MANKKIKLNVGSYIALFPFMPEDLNLKGIAYIVFAIIFGYSKGKQGCFNGSISYLMKWTNSSNRAVINALDYLCERNLIIKEEKRMNGCVKYCSYKANVDVDIIAREMEKSSPVTSEESSLAMEKSSPVTSEESSHNNIDI